MNTLYVFYALDEKNERSEFILHQGHYITHLVSNNDTLPFDKAMSFFKKLNPKQESSQQTIGPFQNLEQLKSFISKLAIYFKFDQNVIISQNQLNQILKECHTEESLKEAIERFASLQNYRLDNQERKSNRFFQ